MLEGVFLWSNKRAFEGRVYSQYCKGFFGQDYAFFGILENLLIAGGS
jgi:hypothetical protein